MTTTSITVHLSTSTSTSTTSSCSVVISDCDVLLLVMNCPMVSSWYSRSWPALLWRTVQCIIIYIIIIVRMRRRLWRSLLLIRCRRYPIR